MNNQENIAPPALVRQTTTDFSENEQVAPLPPALPRQGNGPYVAPQNNPLIIPMEDENDPLLQPHGQFDFSPMPNGLNGYTLDDYENIARNNGWFIPEGDYEIESLSDSESESEDEDAVMHDAVNNFNP